MANPVLNHPRFHDETAAFEWVERIVWPKGPVCPHCGNVDSGRIGRLQNQRTKPTKKNPEGKPVLGLWKCYACRQPFTVRIGTIFEDSHAPLSLWLQAMYLLASSKKGISTNQLARTLGVHMKTAWHMSHRIRLAMDGSGSGPLGGPGKTLESDETFYGRKPDAPEPWVFTNGRGWHKRRPGTGSLGVILTLVERGGAARSVRLPDLKTDTLRKMIRQYADPRSALRTDERTSYRPIGPEFASHESVNHKSGEYARGDAHINNAEAFFSVFKRGMNGVYQRVDERHIHRYLAEFDFRYSNRAALGVSDEERADRLIRGIVGKRLTYRETIDAKKTKAAR